MYQIKNKSNHTDDVEKNSIRSNLTTAQQLLVRTLHRSHIYMHVVGFIFAILIAVSHVFTAAHKA